MKQHRNIRYNLLIILFAFSINVNAQSDWQTVQLDDNISFAIPAGYEQRDTLSQSTFIARFGQTSMLMVEKIPQSEVQIRSEEELVLFYRRFRESILREYGGHLVSDSVINRFGFQTYQYTFEKIWKDTTEVHTNLTLFVDNSVYNFTFVNLRRDQFKTREWRNAFFKGIKIHDSDPAHQLTVSTGANRVAELIGYAFRYILLSVVILAVFLWYRKKYNLVTKIKNTLGLTLLSWGGVCTLLFVVNIFFQVYIYSLLIMGSVCLVVGFALRKFNVPLRTE